MMRKYNALFLKEPATIGSKEIKFFDVSKGAEIVRDGDFYTVRFDGHVREIPAGNVRWAEPDTASQLFDAAVVAVGPRAPRARKAEEATAH